MIVTSSLGKEGCFLSGSKYNYIEWAEYNGYTFKIGMNVIWFNPDEISAKGNMKKYTGKIKWMILFDDGDVQVDFNDHLGRVGIKDLEIPY